MSLTGKRSFHNRGGRLMPRGKGYLNAAEKNHVFALHAIGNYLHKTANQLEGSGWGDIVRRIRQSASLVQGAADIMMAEIDDWKTIKSMARRSAKFTLGVIEL